MDRRLCNSASWERALNTPLPDAPPEAPPDSAAGRGATAAPDVLGGSAVLVQQHRAASGEAVTDRGGQMDTLTTETGQSVGLDAPVAWEARLMEGTSGEAAQGHRLGGQRYRRDANMPQHDPTRPFKEVATEFTTNCYLSGSRTQVGAGDGAPRLVQEDVRSVFGGLVVQKINHHLRAAE